MSEPIIIINGVKLTPAQAMTVRVSINNFVFDLQDSTLGEDEHGKAMSAAYLERVGEINGIIEGKSREVL